MNVLCELLGLLPPRGHQDSSHLPGPFWHVGCGELGSLLAQGGQQGWKGREDWLHPPGVDVLYRLLSWGYILIPYEPCKQPQVLHRGGLGGLVEIHTPVHTDGPCWNPGTWVPKIGPITQDPIIGTEYTRTLIGSPSLIYGRGFTMATISNSIRDMFMSSSHV